MTLLSRGCAKTEESLEEVHGECTPFIADSARVIQKRMATPSIM